MQWSSLILMDIDPSTGKIGLVELISDVKPMNFTFF